MMTNSIVTLLISIGEYKDENRETVTLYLSVSTTAIQHILSMSIKSAGYGR